MITKIERDDIQLGNYFRRITDRGLKCKVPAGELVMIVGFDDDEVEIQHEFGDRGDSWYSVKTVRFLEHFEFEPNGRAIKEAELVELTTRAKVLAGEITSDAEKLSGIETMFRPNLLPGKDELPESAPGKAPSIPVEDVPGVSLERVAPASSMLEQANDWIKNVAERRNEISRKKRDLGEIQKKISALQRESERWIDMVTHFTDIAKKLEDVIATLNLYLGTGEVIVQIANGKPCAADVPLSIRQLILFMDEECALEAERGGIDAYSIEEFDNWLLADPRNLNQILPEEKGIVCLKPRREKKDYSHDAFLDAKLNAPNFETYILIRNGENLFRLCPTWTAGERFFPTKEEFENFFVEYDYQWDEKLGHSKRVRKVLRPGDWKYDQAMEKANKHDRHYSNVVIMLQGIIDRTGIFPEFQEIGLNLMDVTAYNQCLRFVHDADPKRLLVTGRETFREFQKRTNEMLTAGDRVIGTFGRYGDDVKGRVFPKDAGYPASGAIHVLESDGHGGLKILFDRGEVWTWERGYRPAKRRASFAVHRSDDWMLAYDAVTLEDMEYFINDRLSRHAYVDLFLLLREVRNSKRREREDEAPFIRLLAGEIMKIDPRLDEESATSEILPIVQWYKFKNKYHRSLATDDAKALRMIVKEWKVRRITAAGGVAGRNAWAIEKLKTPATIFIGERKSTVIRIERSNADRIFTDRTDFEVRRGELVGVDRREFDQVGKEYMGWTTLWESDEWAKWPKGARIGDFLRPDEIEPLLEANRKEAVKFLKRRAIVDEIGWSDQERAKIQRVLPYRVNLRKDCAIDWYFVISLLDKFGNVFAATMRYTIEWKREKGVPVVRTTDYSSMIDHYGFEPESVGGPWSPEDEPTHVYWFDQGAVDEARRIYIEVAKKKRFQEQNRTFAHSGIENMCEYVNKIREAAAKDLYLKNHGDPLNWEYFKENAGIETLRWRDFDELSDAIETLLNQRKVLPRNIQGLVIDELMELVNAKLPKADRITDVEWPAELDRGTFVVYGYDKKEEEDGEYDDDEED